MSDIQIRKATIEDSSLILGFVKLLAVYEKAQDKVTATVRDIQKSIFGADSSVSALICTIGGKPAGFAVFFFNYSTWLGENGLYLEDLFVSPEFRGSGAGKALLKHLANIAIQKKCSRFEWSVLDWNKPAIDFYDSLGAKPQKEWVKYRLSGNALIKFGRGKRL
ncbi:MAG: GNAT family N-acetyltransferase [Desulfobacula sp.]|nr:GNAT family N-acetyltransferase [Desulfobacula sp.]